MSGSWTHRWTFQGTLHSYHTCYLFFLSDVPTFQYFAQGRHGIVGRNGFIEWLFLLSFFAVCYIYGLHTLVLRLRGCVIYGLYTLVLWYQKGLLYLWFVHSCIVMTRNTFDLFGMVDLMAKAGGQVSQPSILGPLEDEYGSSDHWRYTHHPRLPFVAEPRGSVCMACTCVILHICMNIFEFTYVW